MVAVAAGIYDHVPDARCRVRKSKVHARIGPMQAVYCVNCAVPGGYVSEGVLQIIYLCESCAAKHGALPLPEVDPEELNARQRA